MIRNYVLLTFILIGLFFHSNQTQAHGSKKFEQVTVIIGSKKVKLDYANTAALRTFGLGHKKVICDDCGMLFEFEQSGITSLETKEIFLPLDVAFIREDGEIMRIAQMEPFDAEGESSVTPVLYAVEMNKGWFAAQGIKVGDKIRITSSK